MSTLWLSEAGLIVEKLVEHDIVMFREKHGLQEDAIVMLDEYSDRAEPRGFWTNLMIAHGKLLSKQYAQLFDEVVNLCKRTLPRWVRPSDMWALAPTELWSKENDTDNFRFTNALIERLGLQTITSAELKTKRYLNPDEPDSTKRELRPIVIVTVQHNQAMVMKWKDHEEHIKAVIVLLGTTSRHIENDLHLPTDYYSALINTETLAAMNKQIRKLIIPENIKSPESMPGEK